MHRHYIRHGRKIASIALALSLITSSAFADYQLFYQNKKSSTLSNGVVHETLLRLTDGGWVNVNVLRVDLTNPDLKIKPIYPTYLSSKSSLSNISKAYDNLIGSVNADFFDPATSSTLGPIVDEGTLVTTPNGDTRFAALNITSDNQPFINYWGDYQLQLVGSSYTMALNYINKPYLTYDRAIVFDSKWASKSFGKTANTPILEMYVVNGTVVSFRENGEPYPLSDNAFVVAAVGKKIDEMRAQFKVGDTALVDYSYALKNIDFTIGGGSVMVKEGKAVTNYTLNIAGQHPRTAAGITSDKKQMILLTVDGRSNNFRGLSQPELAQLLIELGAYDAINLDGGGSTTMVVRPVGTTDLKVANTPSDGPERRVHNGIGVISTAQGGTLNSLILDSPENGVFKDTAISLTLKGIDANRGPVTLDPAQITWSVTGVTGVFKDSSFIPSTSGRAVVKAAYGNLTATKTIEVYQNVVDLIVRPSSLQLKLGEEGSFRLFGLDASGHQASLSTSTAKWTIPNELIALRPDGTFTAGGKPGKGVITVEYNGIKKHMPIAVGESHTVLYDFEKPSATFLGYPAEVTGSFALLKFSPNGSMGGRLIYDFTKTEATRAAYLMLGDNGITLSGLPDKLGLWVFGNYGYEHMLKAKLVDADGKSVNVEFAPSINWEGWKFVEVAIPSDLKTPVKVERLYVAEDNPARKDRGVIVMDQLVAIRKNALDVTLPKDVDKLPRLEDQKVNTTGGTSLLVYGGFAAGNRLNGVAGSKTNTTYQNYLYAASQLNKASKTYFAGPIDLMLANLMGTEVVATGYSEMIADGVVVMTLNTKNQSILKSNAAQWKSFLSRVDAMIANGKEKSLVIVTNTTLEFSDKLEEDLFYEKLGQLYGKGIKTTIFSGGASKEPDLRLTRFATVVDVQSLTPASSFDLKTGVKAIAVNLKDGAVTYQIRQVPLKK
jgi:exopolysaccharide biosynthesis protein